MYFQSIYLNILNIERVFRDIFKKCLSFPFHIDYITNVNANFRKCKIFDGNFFLKVRTFFIGHSAQ